MGPASVCRRAEGSSASCSWPTRKSSRASTPISEPSRATISRGADEHDDARSECRMRRDPLAYLDGELNALREQGLFRPLRVLDGEQAAHTSIDHRSVVNLSSNNYLGFTSHPRLRERALAALESLGVGTGSVRT